MASRQLCERIVDVLSTCSEDPALWPIGIRGDCSLVHARFEALKLDCGEAEAWRQAKVDWLRGKLKEAGLARIVYHFRDSASLRG
jgi:hypothetical protein